MSDSRRKQTKIKSKRDLSDVCFWCAVLILTLYLAMCVVQGFVQCPVWYDRGQNTSGSWDRFNCDFWEHWRAKEQMP